MTNRERGVREKEPFPANVGVVIQGQVPNLEECLARADSYGLFSFPESREVLRTAGEVLNLDFVKLVRGGNQSELKKHIQAVTLAANYSLYLQALKTGIINNRIGFLGNSHGEYQASIASGSVTLEDGFFLLDERERLMREENERVPGMMAAVVGFDEPTLKGICENAGPDVYIATETTKTGFVIGGKRGEVKKTINDIRETPELRTKAVALAEFPEYQASHTPLMGPVRVVYENVLRKVNFSLPRISLFQNVTGTETTTADQVRNYLGEQLVNRVRLGDAMREMVNKGVEFFVEIGIGDSTLAKLPQRLGTGKKGVCINGQPSLDDVLAQYT